MRQLKPMIIIILMLTSALAGCTSTDTSDLEQQIADLQQSNDEMNETINQQNQLNLELQIQLDEKTQMISTRETSILSYNTNIAELESSISNNSSKSLRSLMFNDSIYFLVNAPKSLSISFVPR